MIATTAVSAQIFECIDAKGAREYGNYCPAGTVQQREITTGEGAAPGAAAPAPPKSLETQDVEFRKRLLERQEAETKATQEKSNAEDAARNCTLARGQLRGYQEGQRTTRINPDTGERTIIGDSELAGAIEEARKSVEQWCKK